jgi:hypothetical protein
MRQSPLRVIPICCAALIGSVNLHPAGGEPQREGHYRIETRTDRAAAPDERFGDSHIALLEKLNRADIRHLGRLPALVVPQAWGDELSHSILPLRYPSSEPWPTFLVVYLPGQLFGAYESGRLVRWGPVSSGGRRTPTSAGSFALNWRSTGRASTVDPGWFMRWYFNFGNREGLAFHAYSLPGYPASHGCIRLLERDARWLFEWGQTWVVDPTATRVLTRGTPVYIVGRYDFAAAPPWRSPRWLSTIVELPPPSTPDIASAAPRHRNGPRMPSPRGF